MPTRCKVAEIWMDEKGCVGFQDVHQSYTDVRDLRQILQAAISFLDTQLLHKSVEYLLEQRFGNQGSKSSIILPRG